jgi:hypothetical protein
MKKSYLIGSILCILFASSALLVAQPTRDFHAQHLVLDNGSNTKTSTLEYNGGASQILDLTNMWTNSGNLTLGMNLDLTNHNILNGDTGIFTSVKASGAINTTSGTFQINGTDAITATRSGRFNGISGNVVTATPSFYAMSTDDYTVIANNFSFGTILVLLPLASSVKGQTVTIIAGTGGIVDVAVANFTNDIGIVGTLSSSWTVFPAFEHQLQTGSNGGVVTLVSDGVSKWYVTSAQ